MQIKTLFGDVIINAIKNAGFAVSAIILIQVVARAGLSLYECKFGTKHSNSDVKTGTSEVEVETSVLVA